MPQPVTTNLLHSLVAGSHAEGTTRLAVAAVIEDHERVLLVDTGCSWEPPSDLVLPGETLLDALHRSVALVTGLQLDQVTSYLGHHDLVCGDEVVRTFVFAATTQQPASLPRRTPGHAWRWAAVDDLPDDLDDDLLRFIDLAAPRVDADHPELPPRLLAALRAHARGLLAAEAAVELLIAHRFWLRRNDFTDDYVDTGAVFGNTTPLACVDWPAAISALDSGALVCSSSQGQMLRIAASLADGIPIDLRDALTGLDDDNLDLVVHAVLHTGGH